MTTAAASPNNAFHPDHSPRLTGTQATSVCSTPHPPTSLPPSYHLPITPNLHPIPSPTLEGTGIYLFLHILTSGFYIKMSDRGNEDTRKYTYRYTRASRVTYGGAAGSRQCYQSFFITVLEFSSLNSLLTAEATGYVNIDKANIMTGEERYKINVQILSISGL